MALTRLSDDMDIIVKLDDEPNDVGGLSADELKAKFDEAANLIKEYLNSVLLVELEQDGASSIGVQNVEGLTATTLKGALEDILRAMEDITQGSVADASITAQKLASEAVETAKVKDGNITSAKLADGSVSTTKIANSAVTTAKINNKAVTTDKINDYGVTAIKLGTGSVIEAKLANSAVTNGKIANAAVSATKIADSAVTTAKHANASVTRAKLANDALYSPLNKPTTTTLSISASDLGKTIVDGFNTRASALTWTLSRAVADAFDIGTEIAFARTYNTVGITVVLTGMRIINSTTGQIGGAAQTIRVSLPERGSMFALKKLENDATYGSFWLMTGDCEVVS